MAKFLLSVTLSPHSCYLSSLSRVPSSLLGFAAHTEKSHTSPSACIQIKSATVDTMFIKHDLNLNFQSRESARLAAILDLGQRSDRPLLDIFDAGDRPKTQDTLFLSQPPPRQSDDRCCFICRRLCLTLCFHSKRSGTHLDTTILR